MFCIEDKHTKRVLCELFLSLVLPKVQRTSGEEIVKIPNMQFKDVTNIFWGTYDRVTKDKVKENKERLTTAW